MEHQNIEQKGFVISRTNDAIKRKKRFGWIARLDEEKSQVWVDFDGNPLGRPLIAELGRPFRLDDLQKAMELGLDIKVEFAANEIERPVVADIFYSILDKGTDRLADKELMITSKKLSFKASESISLECGDTKITLENNRRGINLHGENVTSTAANHNRIRGGHVSLN